MDKLERLKIFCLIAEKQSFAEVAKILSLPRSNVTYAIQSLEKEYEILLFYRTTRKVSLTHEGSIFYDEALRLVAQLKELNRFKASIKTEEGKISLGVPTRLATEIIIPNLTEFYIKYPKIKILINSQDNFSNLIEQQLDCVVRVGKIQDEYLRAKPITQSKILTLASPKYLTHFGIPRKIEDLKYHFAVDYHIRKHYQEYSELFFKDVCYKVPYRILVEDTQSYLQAGLSGMGIIQIPDFDGDIYLKNGMLQQIFIDIPSLHVPITLLLTDKKYRPAYFQDFIDYLENLLKRKLNKGF